MEGKLTNPYKTGADQGLLFGLYMIALFFASAFALKVPMLGMLSSVMLLAIPVVLFMLLRRTWVRDGGMSQFSALWMQGIMIFACGALISGIVAYIYMRWINPGWLMTQMQQMIELYRTVDGGDQVADILQDFIDGGMLPSPIELVIQMLWFQIFIGSILSLILTIIVRLFKPRS